MFCEVNDLRHLIIRPPVNEKPSNPIWQDMVKLLDCTFLVDPREVAAWQKQFVNSAHVISYDVSRVPPILGCIKKALEIAQYPPYESAYVTWNGEEIREAIGGRVGTVLVDAPIDNFCPDIEVENLTDLLNVIREVVKGKVVGHIGEVVSHTFWGRLAPMGKLSYISVEQPLSVEKDISTQVYALGRYFAAGDERSKKHAFTQCILDTAKNGNQNTIMSLVLGCVIAELDSVNDFDLIVGVPSKPCKPRYLEALISDACKLADKNRLTKAGLEQRFKPAKLVCRKKYPSQRGLNSQERAENVKGAFQAHGVDGVRHALLIDDIFTTGATSAECIRTLKGAGVSRVTALVLGYSQHYSFANSYSLRCL